MTTAKILKIIGALIFLFSITLPMSSCTYYQDPEGNRYSKYTDPNRTIPHNAEPKVIKNYALTGSDPLDSVFWITILLFTWPVITLGALRWRPSGRINLTIRGLEPLLLAGSVLLINVVSTFLAERREIGAYVALIGLGFYSAGTIWIDFLIYKNWKNDKRT